MNRLTLGLLFLISFGAISGCATRFAGAFSDTTFVDENQYADFRRLGSVKGESCQTRILYILPRGEGPSTDKALANAKAVYEETVFLANLSIESGVQWKFFYSYQCIYVSGEAYMATEK